MGGQASSPLPFYQWSAKEVGISAARLIDPSDAHPCITFFIHHNLCGARITAMPNLTEVSNLLFRCGNADILHHRILRLFLTMVPGGLPCEHPFIEAVRMGDPAGEEEEEEEKTCNEAEVKQSQYRCLDCKSRVVDAVKIQQEEEKTQHSQQRRHIQQEMHAQRQKHMPQEQQQLLPPVGVSVAWLVHWTREHHCWHMPTWLVRRLFVLPLTSQTHCCYADLPHMQEERSSQPVGQQQGAEAKKSIISTGEGEDERSSERKKEMGQTREGGSGQEHATGPAHTFICHKWGDLWGDLVRAVAEHASPNWNLRVYLDVFCCNPYQQQLAPSPVIMRQCQDFLLVSPSLEHITKNQSLSPLQTDKLISPHFWTLDGADVNKSSAGSQDQQPEK